MPTWFAAVIALAAITVTYLFCVRPMLRGRCATTATDTALDERETDRQLGELREEVRILRAQDALGAGQPPSGTPGPAR
jgi:hypothetical protein